MEHNIKVREYSFAISNLEKYRNTKDKALLRHLHREVCLKKISYYISKFEGGK